MGLKCTSSSSVIVRRTDWTYKRLDVPSTPPGLDARRRSRSSAACTYLFILLLTAVVRTAVQRRPRSQSSHASANLEAPVHRVRDGSSDTHTHTQDLRLLLISCAASAQWWAGARDDLKMRENAKRLEETGVRERPQHSNRANVCENKQGVSANLAPGQTGRFLTGPDQSRASVRRGAV